MTYSGENQQRYFSSKHSLWFPVCGLFLILSSALVIISAARGDLWLDEIWSLSFAQRATSATDIFSRFKHDNNHPLNTLFMYSVGEQAHLPVYRILSVLSGIASVILSGYISLKTWGKSEALLSIVLMGFSYPLVLYFSEARGYAPAIFFGLACYTIFSRNLTEKNWTWAVVFWGMSILGFLSHASFIILSISFFAWSFTREMCSFSRMKTSFGALLRVHGIPLGFFACWYFYFINEMAIGRGPQYDLLTVLGQTGSVLLGLPAPPLFTFPVILCLITLGSLGIARLGNARLPTNVFFISVLLISPFTVLFLASPDFLYFRYFIVCFPFFYLLLSHLLVVSFQRSAGISRFFICAIFSIGMCGHFVRDIQLIRFGRGQYTDALEYMVSHSKDKSVSVGSDQDFRNNMLIEFYAPSVPGGTHITYVERSDRKNRNPNWIITHHQSLGHVPLKTLSVRGQPDVSYVLRKEFPYSGISGWNWYLYHLETP